MWIFWGFYIKHPFKRHTRKKDFMKDFRINRTLWKKKTKARFLKFVSHFWNVYLIFSFYFFRFVFCYWSRIVFSLIPLKCIISLEFFYIFPHLWLYHKKRTKFKTMSCLKMFVWKQTSYENVINFPRISYFVDICLWSLRKNFEYKTKKKKSIKSNAFLLLLLNTFMYQFFFSFSKDFSLILITR